MTEGVESVDNGERTRIGVRGHGIRWEVMGMGRLGGKLAAR